MVRVGRIKGYRVRVGRIKAKGVLIGGEGEVKGCEGGRG